MHRQRQCSMNRAMLNGQMPRTAEMPASRVVHQRGPRSPSHVRTGWLGVSSCGLLATQVANAFRQWTSNRVIAVRDPAADCARGNVLVECRGGRDARQARTCRVLGFTIQGFMGSGRACPAPWMCVLHAEPVDGDTGRCGACVLRAAWQVGQPDECGSDSGCCWWS